MPKRHYSVKEARNLVLQDSESDSDLFYDNFDSLDSGWDEASTEAELGK